MGVNSEDRQKLLAALRSGQYRQLKGQFDDGTGVNFCVMGLAHHLDLHPFTMMEELAVGFMNHGTDMTYEQIADRIEAGDFEVCMELPKPLRQHLEAMERIRRIQAGERPQPPARKWWEGDGGGDDDPPPVPAVICIRPRPRPQLSSAVGRWVGELAVA